MSNPKGRGGGGRGGYRGGHRGGYQWGFRGQGAKNNAIDGKAEGKADSKGDNKDSVNKQDNKKNVKGEKCVFCTGSQTNRNGHLIHDMNCPHIQRCEFCGYQSNRKTFDEIHYGLHEMHPCKIKYKCKYCFNFFFRGGSNKQAQQHDKICNMKATCTICCKSMRKDDIHITGKCPSLRTCTFCNNDISCKDYKTHLQQCPNRGLCCRCKTEIKVDSDHAKQCSKTMDFTTCFDRDVNRNITDFTYCYECDSHVYTNHKHQVDTGHTHICCCNPCFESQSGYFAYRQTPETIRQKFQTQYQCLDCHEYFHTEAELDLHNAQGLFVGISSNQAILSLRFKNELDRQISNLYIAPTLYFSKEFLNGKSGYKTKNNVLCCLFEHYHIQYPLIGGAPYVVQIPPQHMQSMPYMKDSIINTVPVPPEHHFNNIDYHRDFKVKIAYQLQLCNELSFSSSVASPDSAAIYNDMETFYHWTRFPVEISRIVLVYALSVCPSKASCPGCTAFIPKIELEKHVAQCKSLVVCTYCGYYYERKELEYHQHYVCSTRHQCNRCGQSIPNYLRPNGLYNFFRTNSTKIEEEMTREMCESDQQYLRCQYPYRPGFYGWENHFYFCIKGKPTGIVAYHEEVCPEVVLSCSHCQTRIKRQDLLAHENQCPEAYVQFINCKNCNFAGYHKRKETRHVCMKTMLEKYQPKGSSPFWKKFDSNEIYSIDLKTDQVTLL